MSSTPTDYKKEYIKQLKTMKKELKSLNNDSWRYWSRGIDIAIEAIDVAISDIRKDKRDGALVMFSSDNLKYPTTKKEAAKYG